MNVYEYLDQSNVGYSVTEHTPVYSAQMLAAEEHENGQFVAKPVIVKVDSSFVMCVLAAPNRVDFGSLANCIGAKNARLASVEEMTKLFPDCEEGSEAPIGNLYGIQTIVDSRLEGNDHVLFQAESYNRAIRMSMRDYLTLAQPKVFDFAYCPGQTLVFDKMEQGLRFFVAGDANAVDSTISLGWCVDKRILEELRECGEKNPLLLISVISIPEIGCHGEEVLRKLVPLGQAMEFIQLRRPGNHEIIGTIVYRYDRISEAKRYFLETHSYRLGSFINHLVRVAYNAKEQNGFMDFSRISDVRVYRVGMGRLNIHADKEFFAPKPPAWVKWWGNLWYRYDPIDQCDFRKRLIHAFTWKPFAFAFWFVGKELFVFLAWMFLMTIGIKGLRLSSCSHPLIYGVSYLWDDIDEFIFFNKERPYLAPLCPIVFLLLFSSLVFIEGGRVGLCILLSLLACIGASAIVLVSILLIRLMRASKIIAQRPIHAMRMAREEQERQEREKALAATYAGLASLVCCSQSERDFKNPTLSTLPAEKKTFHLRFWNLKAKVCKPFADR